jgi:hypothetical protein
MYGERTLWHCDMGRWLNCPFGRILASMNPDLYSYEYYAAQGRAERREREQQRQQSRAAQPRRRDNIKVAHR